ncbi:bifunctional riboflavin kinase/FAD synthetase [soil metagenome]
MQVYYGAKELPKLNNAVITIGTFDGVHTGHAQIINQLKTEAALINGETVIITFDPHPRMVVQADKNSDTLSLLNTLEEKIELISNHGVDHLVVVAFTTEFSEQSADAYIRSFLVNNFHPKVIIIGYDHHFGKARAGNYKMLEQYAGEFNYRVKEIPEHVLNDITISSTKIRNALLSGDIETANEFLGYDYSFEGTVVHGDKLGRTLGFPTANIEISDDNKLIPANGVYAVEVALNPSGTVLKGMMNIGRRPTVGGVKQMIEVHIFDTNEDLYDTTLCIFMKKYLRQEIKFNGLDQLKDQLQIDKQHTLSYFRKY